MQCEDPDRSITPRPLQGTELHSTITRTIGGYEFVSTPEDQKKVDEAIALLQAYVDAMMPVSLYNEKARTKAFQNATWAVMDVVIDECDRERAERQKK